jgi:hypothetical protein
MNSKQLESLIKECLSSYRNDFNRINPNDPVDFHLEIVPQTFDPSKVNREGLGEEALAKIDAMPVQENYYIRLSKIFEKRTEQRVIFAAYRPEKEFKTIELASKSLYRECLDHLIVAGIEYVEALQQMEDKDINKLEEEPAENG